VVLPLRDHRDELVLRARDLSILAEDGQGTSWDPIKVEGVVPADSTNAIEATGAGFEPIDPGAGDPQDDAGTSAEVVEASTKAADAAAGPDVPPMHSWNARASAPTVPGRDAYALRLVSGRTLYDGSRTVSETPVLARLIAEGPVLRVNPADTARLGLDPGARVRVSTARGSHDANVWPDDRVVAGTARYDFSADGGGPALLIDGAEPVTDVRLEKVT
jgi:anaerobic selenocysteine-containing dehydrogenase